MDVVERLTVDEASEPTLLALTHVHRYELAAQLCAGKRVLDLCCGSGYGSRILARSAAAVVGVDNDEATIAAARERFGDVDGLEFDRADALDYLGRPLREHFDAVVLLEGLEHLADAPRALDRLRAQAEAGVVLVVSIPNSATFGERNRFHVTDFDYDSAMEAVEQLPSPTVLYQFHAEGSLIRGAEAEGVEGRQLLSERGDAEHANHFIVVVNADVAADGADGRMQLAVAPAFNSYMVELERANRELWRTNHRLSREYLGVADSAAAAQIAPAPPQAPRGVDTVARVGVQAGKGLAALILNILPYRLTMIVIGIRTRLKEDQPR
jgi:SAM-dependent methyltransferase